MPQRLLARLVVAATLSFLICSAAAAEPSAAALAHEAITECEGGRQVTDRAERARRFARGEELALRAVALDDDCADAHFAVFCNRGETMRLDGESITDVLKLRGLVRELDRTLALAPNHPGALVAKGTLLVRLPRILGGDMAQGEQLLHRVLVLDPDTVTARISLARVCEYRGKRDEGVQYARRALESAHELGRADKIAEAQAMLAELGAN